MGRKLLWASLVLAPVTFVLRYVLHVGDVTLFVFAAASLVPLAWLIGEATEQAGEHTGPGIGGFLNASFGNAPELIIALFAVADGLPDVVRGSLTGSIVSNLLLVLGVALAAGAEGGRSLDRRSLLSQLALVLVAVLLFVIPSVPGWTGNPNRHSLAVATLAVASVLLLLYLVGTTRGLRRHARLHAESGAERSDGWSLPWALAALAVATVVTAFVSETLIHSLDAFSQAVGLSQFFTATVIVAIVGNAAEHGGAIVIARRGNLRLASEIAVSSAAQVALLVTPAVALLSWIVKPALALSFRPIELGTMGASAVVVALVVRNGRATRREGLLLIGLYILAAVGFFIAGDR
ncbi:MAG TPA: calcium/proton exchanger [Gaiellaceae bacterium]|nr:calcium/proton exchanger [Gaiellaceae bacterium]